MTTYIRCSECGENRFRNPNAYKKCKEDYPEAKEEKKGKSVILIGTTFICRDCRKKEETVEPTNE